MVGPKIAMLIPVLTKPPSAPPFAPCSNEPPPTTEPNPPIRAPLPVLIANSAPALATAAPKWVCQLQRSHHRPPEPATSPAGWCQRPPAKGSVGGEPLPRAGRRLAIARAPTTQREARERIKGR